MSDIFYVLLGLISGILSGLMGIGGGIIIIPALIAFWGYTQHQAQGTTLALMVPPIGLLAAWTYYKSGSVKIMPALFICAGFFVGGLLGAKLAVTIPQDILRKIFAVAIIMIGIKMFVNV